MLRGRPASLRVRWTAGAAAALLYAIGSHLLMTRAQDSAWAMAVVLGPLAVLGTAGLWRSGQRAWAAALAVAAVAVAAPAASGHGLSSRWLYLAQHAGVHLALAAWFGATLRPGARPLITMLAARVHGSLTPAMAVYTRRVTWAWVLYFLGMAAVSLALFAAGDFALWSLLANLLTPALIVAMFVGEYLVRYWLHPEFERVSLRKGLQAYRAHRQVAGGNTPAATES